MPDALKNLYSKTLIKNLCYEIRQLQQNFDAAAFSRSVFDKHWQQKELKQRMRHITECLQRYLPADYIEAIEILKPVATKFSGFEYMFFQDFVECYGLHDFKTSVDALEHFTKHASSEFAVRAFILQDEKRMMKQMLAWARSDNHHVRRLASEGCRPRLPWAVALPAFKKDPQAVLKVLKVLLADESEYVRRSVANNLNDIAKDHPDVIIDWAERYLGKDKNTDRLIKHACRTLLKQGDKNTLRLFGYMKPSHISTSEFKVQDKVVMGEQLAFSFTISSNQKHLGRCRLEFAIDFVKANAKRSRKVFKIAEGDYPKNKKQVNKKFSFRKISTRKYYAGKHQLTIIINGVAQISKTFTLKV